MGTQVIFSVRSASDNQRVPSIRTGIMQNVVSAIDSCDNLYQATNSIRDIFIKDVSEQLIDAVAKFNQSLLAVSDIHDVSRAVNTCENVLYYLSPYHSVNNHVTVNNVTKYLINAISYKSNSDVVTELSHLFGEDVIALTYTVMMLLSTAAKNASTVILRLINYGDYINQKLLEIRDLILKFKHKKYSNDISDMDPAYNDVSVDELKSLIKIAVSSLNDGLNRSTSVCALDITHCISLINQLTTEFDSFDETKLNVLSDEIKTSVVLLAQLSQAQYAVFDMLVNKADNLTNNAMVIRQAVIG